jgi:hypothetical protein
MEDSLRKCPMHGPPRAGSGTRASQVDEMMIQSCKMEVFERSNDFFFS